MASVSATDVSSWSATGLAAHTVAQLQALATAAGAALINVDDASRGSRRGRPLLKADYIGSRRPLAQWDRVFFNIMQPAGDGRELRVAPTACKMIKFILLIGLAS